VIACGDALGELAKLGPVQQGAEFGLAQQDDSQQLSLVRLQIGQQADLFQHRR
jgi:hypothetical protein